MGRRLAVMTACVFGLGLADTAHALPQGPSRPPRSSTMPRMREGAPVLAPFHHVRFCIAHPGECAGSSAGASHVELTADRLLQLQQVNRSINSRIRTGTKRDNTRLGPDWSINPASGDCNDYAVSKRHELTQRGWPSQSLALSVVETSRGEGHLVLVVRTSEGDLVLDNLTSVIRLWSHTNYRWLKQQSAANPKFWVAVRGEREGHFALRADERARLF